MEQELALYSIANLKSMEIVDISTGAKLGFIKDLKINCDSSKILSIVLPANRMAWFGKSEDIEIPWQNIKKIGIDVVLVEGGEFILDEK